MAIFDTDRGNNRLGKDKIEKKVDSSEEGKNSNNLSAAVDGRLSYHEKMLQSDIKNDSILGQATPG